MSRPSSRPSTSRPSRRAIVQGVLTVGGLGMTGASALAQELPVTPQCHDGDPATARQTAGPFFLPGSSDRAELVEAGAKARQVELTGFVLTRGCNPVARALVDLWHADERGNYDTKGFRYRGHVYTDEHGRYRFRTIEPAVYPGRTRHYHINVAAGGKLLLTTQLYFPNDPANRRDGLFRKELVMGVTGTASPLAARFDFVVDLRI